MLRGGRRRGGGDADPGEPAAPAADGSGGADGADDGPDGGGGEPDRRTLGGQLRARRLELGDALEDAQAATKIAPAYLEAIEHDRYDLMPAPVYARGFVRLYARYLGFDPEEALALVPGDLPKPQGLEPLPSLRRRAGAPAVPAIGRRWLLLAVLAAAAVAAALVFGLPGAPAIGPFGGGDGAEAPATPAAAPAGTLPQPPPAPTTPPFAEGTTPDFTGVERAEAEAVLRGIGAALVVIEVASGEQLPGRVFAQTPEPGAALGVGDEVTLIVAQDPGGG